MAEYVVHCRFAGRLVIVGFGSIGAGTLPLLLRHVGISPKQITIVTSDTRSAAIAAEYGVEHVVAPVTRANYRTVVGDRIGPGDFLLNLSVDVSSLALVDEQRGGRVVGLLTRSKLLARYHEALEEH